MRMDKNNIKSKDLCERCMYGYFRHCYGKDCTDCEMNGGKKCKCIMIKEGAPCPYFREEVSV